MWNRLTTVVFAALICSYPIFPAHAGVNTWTCIGPSSGWIRALVIDPNNQDIIYAGTAGGGVFKSNDSGNTWSASSINLVNLNIYTLAINPDNPAILYAGTWGGGIYKSANSGATWTEINTGIPKVDDYYIYIYALAIDPVTPNILYAGTWGGGIFKSMDSGGTWTAVNTNLTDAYITSLVIDAVNPATLYAGSAGGGVFKSSNSGATWAASNTNLTNQIVYSLAINPGSSTVLYAGTEGGIFKSADSGATWAASNTNLTNLNVYSLTIDPANTSTLYAGTWGGGIFKSTDSGAAWAAADVNPTNLFVYTLTISPQNSSKLYAGTWGGGIFKSSNSGSTWSAINSDLNNVFIRVLGIVPVTPTTLYAGTWGNGVYKSPDGGATWAAINSGLANLEINSLAINPATPSTLYVGSWGGGIFKSSDNGASWSAANSGLANLYSTALVIDPSAPSILYAGTTNPGQPYNIDGGVFKSTDSGATWSATSLTKVDIYSLAINPTNTSTLYAGTWGSGIFKSTDNGTSWSALNTSSTSSIVNSIDIDPVTPSTLYAGTWGGGVVKSTDSGENWSSINKNLSGAGLYVNAIAVDPVNTTTLYTGTAGGGIYKRRDSGSTWTAVNANLFSLHIYTLAIDPAHTNILYSGTGGASLWQMELRLPYISASDSVSPADDLQIPFENIVLGTAVIQTATITNAGTSDLSLGTIANADPIKAPFSIINDSCSDSTIPSAESCSVTIQFAPTETGVFSDTFDIPSNDPETASIAMQLSGSGTPKPAPSIIVTDSVAPSGDLIIVFGDILQNTTGEQTVTLNNKGNSDLTVGTIGGMDPPTTPFGISADSCSNRSLQPAASCTITVQFSPSATGTFSGTFVIPSNDPTTPTITMTLSGVGTAKPVPDIEVLDSLAPGNDLQMAFGKVTVGVCSSFQTVKISNVGTAPLQINSIQLSGSDSGDFTVNLNSGARPCKTTSSILAVGDYCTSTVTFSPLSAGVKNSLLAITSDDPDESEVRMALSGTGLAGTINNPPSAPLLVYPANGQAGLGTTVDFRWKKTTDPDGDAVTYKFSACTNNSVSDCNPIEVAVPGMSPAILFGTGVAGSLMVFSAVGRARNRRNGFIFLLGVSLLLFSFFLPAACGSGATSSSVSQLDEITYTATGLTPGSTYYWKVSVDDGKDGRTVSTVWIFTTR